jgi:hypothetical protein
MKGMDVKNITRIAIYASITASIKYTVSFCEDIEDEMFCSDMINLS